MKKIITAGVVIALAFGLTGCSSAYTGFQDAVDLCATSNGVLVSDGGNTLSVDMMGEEDYIGAGYGDVLCIIGAVNTPSYIVSAMESTRALDGRQHDEFDGIDVSWSYHPDSGLDILYHKK
jgi:hypothetical protein